MELSTLNVSIDDIMNSMIQSRDDAVVTCNCLTTCSTKKCPCKGLRQPCNSECECGKKKPCKNGKTVTSSSDSEDDNPDTTLSQARKVRKRARQDEPNRSTLEDELRRQHQAIEEYVQGLAHPTLVQVCIDIFKRCPGAYTDYILLGAEFGEQSQQTTASQPVSEGAPMSPASPLSPPPATSDSPPGSPPQPESPPHPESPPQPESPPHPESPHPNGGMGVPPWCRCGHCRRMQRQIEHKCCRPARGHNCITMSDEFARLCVDPMVLDVAMRIHEDVLAELPDRSNANYRHQAYRTWTYWQHGRLGRGNRRVVPSCAVWAIRNRFPEPSGIYKGFIEGAGYMND